MPGAAIHDEAARLQALSETEPFALVDTPAELAEDELDEPPPSADEPAQIRPRRFWTGHQPHPSVIWWSTPLPAGAVTLTAEVIERIASVLRGRSPVRLDPPTGATPLDAALSETARAATPPVGTPPGTAGTEPESPEEASSGVFSVADGMPEGAR